MPFVGVPGSASSAADIASASGIGSTASGTTSLANELNEIKEAMRRLDATTGADAQFHPQSLHSSSPSGSEFFIGVPASRRRFVVDSPSRSPPTGTELAFDNLDRLAEAAPSLPNPHLPAVQPKSLTSSLLDNCGERVAAMDGDISSTSTVCLPGAGVGAAGSLPTNLATLGLGGSTSSTKAVLSALRALQDKIRRLEAERQSAVDQCTRLRAKIQQVEMQAQQHLDREVQRASELGAEQASSIERLSADKSGLEARLNRWVFVPQFVCDRPVNAQRLRRLEGSVVTPLGVWCP